MIRVYSPYLPLVEESSNQEEAMAEAADIVTKMAFKVGVF